MSSSSTICGRCNEAITTQQFIRVGNCNFHQNHFLCEECGKDLRSVKFHRKNDKFYCNEDYIEKFSQTCRHCNQKITSRVLSVLGAYYHPEHFVCYQCHKPFSDGKYYEGPDSQPFCEEHYYLLSAQKCAACNLPVNEKEGKISVQNVVYHPKCVSCDHCHASLASSDAVYRKNDKIYCHEHYVDFFCKVCTACGKPILDHCIGVNFEYYHPDCLKCSTCDKKLERYLCVSGHLRCAQHQEDDFPLSVCNVCKKNIYGEIIRAAGQKVHPDCFNCGFCGIKLNRSDVKLKQDKLCCKDCLISKEAKKIEQESSFEFSEAKEALSDLGLLSAVKPTPSLVPPLSPIGAGPLSPKVEVAEAAVAVIPAPLGGPVPPPEGKAKASEKEDDFDDDKESDIKDQKIIWKKGALIGQGAFGKVFEALNVATGELIAVKEVTLDASSDEAVSEIENEINVMRKLRHKNIVSLLGTESENKTLCILMEYVPGKSLDNLLQKYGELGEPVIRNYTKQILEALAYCHSRHVMHRDIKGKNILVDKTGLLKLADFGSAKRFANAVDRMAPTSSYNYTPLWTAPEVLVGDYNTKVDIWSLGCVIIEMATAKAPWSELNFENPFRALYHIGNSGAIPKLPDNLSKLGIEFVKLCLQRNPDTRPSAKELLEHEWLKGI